MGDLTPITSLACACAAAVLVIACAAPSLPATQPAATGPTTGLAVTPSALSYGSVTSQVVKGQTTQADLLQAFGGPNISTVDRDGTETWVYERSATRTDVQSNSQTAQATASLGAFFKYVDGKVGGSVERASADSSVSSSFRSLTVIVKFTRDRTVADYSVRASNF
jgi:hypothetical protein